jgi:hypothetical protein
MSRERFEQLKDAVRERDIETDEDFLEMQAIMNTTDDWALREEIEEYLELNAGLGEECDCPECSGEEDGNDIFDGGIF